MSSKILSVQGLTKIYPSKSFSKNKPYIAVNNLNFHLNEGEILGILGPNGAGKTTTLHMLLGILTPTAGDISYFGKNFFLNKSEILQQVTHATAYSKLPGFLTVEESLEIFARIYGIEKNERKIRIKKYLEYFGIDHLKKKRCQSLSAGQMTRLMLVKAFIPHPKIVLLDEPTASLDPDIALDTRRFILEQRQRFQVSMILTSHNMREVSEVCGRVLVLKEGAIIEEDTPQKLAHSVAISKIKLKVEEKKETLIALLLSKSIQFFAEGEYFFIELEEQDIAYLLMEIAEKKIIYSHIEIIKPSLEDYFLLISER